MLLDMIEEITIRQGQESMIMKSTPRTPEWMCTISSGFRLWV